jgi:hypothetical protein
MQTSFTGTGANQNEALQKAITAALDKFEPVSKWTLEETAGDLQGGPISITIGIGGGKGEDASPKPGK